MEPIAPAKLQIGQRTRGSPSVLLRHHLLSASIAGARDAGIRGGRRGTLAGQFVAPHPQASRQVCDSSVWRFGLAFGRHGSCILSAMPRRQSESVLSAKQTWSRHGDLAAQIRAPRASGGKEVRSPR